MFKRVSSVLIIVALFLFAGSCIKDTLDMNKFSKDFELMPGLAIPVGYGSLSIGDLLNRFNKTGYFSQDDSGLLLLAYNSEFISIPANTAFQIPNQIYNQFYIRSEVPFPTLIPLNDSAVIQKVNNYAFNFGKNEKIDSMVVKSGTLQFNFLSSFRNLGMLEIRSSGIRKAGKPYYKKVKVSDPAGNYQNIVTDDISGSTIYFSRVNDTTFIPLDFKLNLSGSANPLRPTDSVKIDFSFDSLKYKTIYGNIGYKSFVNQDGSIPMDIFNPKFKGNISFVNPKFDISIDNSFGIPIQILLTNVSAFSPKNGTTPIAFPPGKNPISVSYPSILEIGQTKNTLISFDSIIPSMTTVINTNPSSFNFTASGYSDTTKLSAKNFIDDTSKFKATIEVTLPMWFRAGDFSLEDTVAFELPNIQGGDIQLAMVRLAIDNGLPVDVKMQVYFADSTFHVLDVMFSDTLPQIPSGVISNTTFKVTSSTSKINDVSFDNVKINKIKKTKWALVKASLTTTDYATKPGLKVKFYDSYKLGFKLYVKAQMKITIKNP